MRVVQKLVRWLSVAAMAAVMAPTAMAQVNDDGDLYVPDDPPPGGFSIVVSPETAAKLRKALREDDAPSTGGKVPSFGYKPVPAPTPTTAPVVVPTPTAAPAKIEYKDLFVFELWSGKVDKSVASPAIELFLVEFMQMHSDKCNFDLKGGYPRVEAVTPVGSKKNRVFVKFDLQAAFERYRVRVDATREQVARGPVSMENLRQSAAAMEDELAKNGCNSETIKRVYENLHRLAHGFTMLDLVSQVHHLYGPIENPDGFFRVSKLGISKIEAEGPLADGTYRTTETEVFQGFGLFGRGGATQSATGIWHPDTQRFRVRFAYEGGCNNWTDPIWEGPMVAKSLGLRAVPAWGGSGDKPRYCTVLRVNPNSCEVVGCRRWSTQDKGPSAVLVANYDDAKWAYENHFGR